MSDDSSHFSASSGWSRGLKRWLSATPETRDELIDIVHDSRQFLQPDTVDMLEGVLDLPATQIREIMTPRPNVVGLHELDGLEDIMAVFLESAHSRYPVFDSQDGDAVIGILLAKDLLPLLMATIKADKADKADKANKGNDDNIASTANAQSRTFRIRDLVRQPLYINENARSDTLLRLLQKTQVHMAVVVDDFGNFAGVVTMEDLLEEIVGDIVDEHDDLDEDSNINNIVPHASMPNVWIVQASTLIESCNEALGAAFDDSEVDTMGGLVMQKLGSVGDLSGESVDIDGWQLTVLQVEGRFIHTLELKKIP